jgi:hypothetical protein
MKKLCARPVLCGHPPNESVLDDLLHRKAITAHGKSLWAAAASSQAPDQV